jgi:hypothetical protein
MFIIVKTGDFYTIVKKSTGEAVKKFDSEDRANSFLRHLLHLGWIERAVRYGV